jgi:hypothetical protein
MKSRKVLISLGVAVAAAATAVLVYRFVRTKKIKKEKRKIHISNEGYELAEDILYPGSKSMKLI